MMSFGPGRVRSIRTCHGSTISGPPVAELAQNFGAASRTGLPGLSSCRWRMDNSSTAVRKGRSRKSAPDPIGQNNRPSYDGRTDTLSKAETVTVAAVEAGVPTLVEARETIAEFHGMIRRKAAAELSPWIERARVSLVASFARGVTTDEAAVRAAITSAWSNGQTEGQITRLKLVRRQMYGRGNIDLLRVAHRR